MQGPEVARDLARFYMALPMPLGDILLKDCNFLSKRCFRWSVKFKATLNNNQSTGSGTRNTLLVNKQINEVNSSKITSLPTKHQRITERCSKNRIKHSQSYKEFLQKLKTQFRGTLHKHAQQLAKAKPLIAIQQYEFQVKTES